ncbi:MAG: sigma-54-dependent Fis family transcriptional regulator [Candidatus Eisenbacteria bacterium]|nr:sigma-54-dependent Fis family transcriptional regulator [Candidatus Eisenbacteria bacterium]
MPPTTSPRVDSIIVWSVGCQEISPELRARGFVTKSWRSVDALLKAPRSEDGLRAIVLHDEALGDRALEPVIRSLRSRFPFVDALLWGPGASAGRVRAALRAGFHDVVLSRTPRRVSTSVGEVIEKQRYLPRMRRARYDGAKTRFEGLLSRSRAMWDVFDACERIARTDATVLVLGETGTGKELVARAIHRRSDRSGRFVAINCGAIPAGLVDSEFFGHKKGAFTGATGDKLGLFRHAEGGTLFLDEIGNLSMEGQSSLLRVLQEGRIRPVGNQDEIPVDVRVVAATSTPLEEEVRNGKFREDLYYRLDVIQLVLPALRERQEDILFLFAHFASRAAKQYKVTRPDVSDGFLEELISYQWPGNVRELENFTERLILSSTSEATLTRKHFRRLSRQKTEHETTPVRETSGAKAAPSRTPSALGLRDWNWGTGTEVDISAPLDENVRRVVESTERSYLRACLAQCEGRVGAAANVAGISRRTLLRKMNQYGLSKEEFRGGASEESE